jgi:hypothetical protein
MPLAEWSGKGAIEYKNYVRLAVEIGQADIFTLEVLKGKIWSRGIYGYS